MSALSAVMMMARWVLTNRWRIALEADFSAGKVERRALLRSSVTVLHSCTVHPYHGTRPVTIDIARAPAIFTLAAVSYADSGSLRGTAIETFAVDMDVWKIGLQKSSSCGQVVEADEPEAS